MITGDFCMKVLILLSLMILASCQDNQIAVDGPSPSPSPAPSVSSGMAPVSGG
jgi:uncharacterized lipoprotein YajG